MAKDSLLDLIYDAHRRLARLESEPRDYGTGRLFYASEIHTLACIVAHPYGNLTSIARELGVSKSAASKFVQKLLAAGCIEKGRAPDNARDVLFHATAAGRRAARGHEQFQEAAFGPLRELEARLGSAERSTIRRFLTELGEALPRERD